MTTPERRGLRSGVLLFNDTATTEIYTLSLHDALPICTDEFVIVAGEEHIALEGDERIVERLDRLQVQVIGRSVEDQYVRSRGQHHATDHTTHLLASRQDRGLLIDLLSAEEHSTKEPLDVDVVRILGKLRQPVEDRHVCV